MSINNTNEFDDGLFDPSLKVTNADIDKKSEQIARMSRVISKFASTLTYRPIAVETFGPGQNAFDKVPAWSDSDNIYLNTQLLGDITEPDNIVSLKGLSLHELGHILLTPRAGSNLVKWVKTLGYLSAFNLLEDMRIEMFLTARYSNVKDWFTGTISQHILQKVGPANIKYLYPMIAGRLYLPAELRNTAASLYAHPASIADINRITKQYSMLNLSDSAHIPLAQALIAEFHNLIKDTLSYEMPNGYQTTGFDTIPDISGHNNKPESMPSSTTSRPMNKAGQDKIIEKIQQQYGQQSNNASGEQEGEEVPTDAPSDDAGNDGSSSGSPGSSNDSKAGDDGDSNDNGTDGKPSNDTAQGGDSAGNGGFESMRNIATDINNKTKDKLRDDIRNTIQQFNGEAELTSKQVSAPQKAQYKNESVAPHVISAARSLGKELIQIKGDYDPGWLRKTEMGKLNVHRYVTGSDIDESFDQWDTGREDAVDMEVVILLDISGSMDWALNDAYDSMWAIKRALDKINASTTVITFGSYSRVLYSSDERASHQRRFSGLGGGTNPIHGLQYAKYIMASSSRAIKIVITITDGVWSYGTKGITPEDAILQEMRRGGVITALAFVDEYDSIVAKHGQDYANNYYGGDNSVDGHGCEVVVKVNHASQLFTLGRKLVKVGIARNLERQV